MDGALLGQQGQLAPQGLFGSLLGGPVGGFLGGALGGALGNQNLGRQIGQAAGAIGGGFLPFNVDPMAAYAQQGQLAPQGFFGNLLGQVGQPLGGAIGGMLGNQGLGSQVGGAVGQLGKFLPFNVDPMTAAYAQQGQLAPQGFFGNLLGQVGQPLGGAIGGILGNQGLGSQVGGAVGQLGKFLPFNVDPMAAYAQQGQLAPQGFFGNLLGQVGQPLGGAIGGILGNQGLGSQVGGAVGQLGKFLPFNVDPMTAAYAQQGQLAPQGFFGNLLGQVGQPLGGAIGGILGNQGLGSQVGGAVGQLGKFLPFNVDPMTAAYAQQGQVAPQGFFGNLLGQVGQPLGGAIGGILGNQGLGSQVGGAVGQLGKFLPFNVDPMTAAYAQQGQLSPQGFSQFLPPSWGHFISPTFPQPIRPVF